MGKFEASEFTERRKVGYKDCKCKLHRAADCRINFRWEFTIK